MSFQIDNKDKWLFPDPLSNTVHDITSDELSNLLKMAEADDLWADRVREEVVARDQAIRDGSWKNRHRSDWLIEEFQILNTGGTVVQYPYGLRAITFPSKRHLFRGENQKYLSTLPPLNRILYKIEDPYEKELHRVIAHMRKWQFAGLLWQINVVPYWEAKLCDVNYDALAQHYGFPTHLLDLTNDFRTALFFATCKYDQTVGAYRPLSDDDINQSEDTKYGYIFHAPDWIIDYFNGGGFANWSFKHLHNGNANEMPDRNKRFYLQSGDMDGVAMQIGYQPLYRCDHQSGYVFPMRNEVSLQENWHFEKLRFKHSERLSKQVFEMMDGGKKVFPNEGISEILDLVEELKHCVTFSITDLNTAYEVDGINRGIFPTLDALRSAIDGYVSPEGRIQIKDEEVIRRIPQELLDKVNSHYDGKDLLQQIGGMIHQKYPDQEYRKQRCIEIYGKMI